MTMREITSTHNPSIRRAVRLRQSRGRRQQQRIIIDGLREIDRALNGQVTPDELFVRRDAPADPLRHSILQRCLEAGVDPTYVAPKVFRSLAFGDRDEGLVLVAQRPPSGLDCIPAPPQGIIGILEGVEKPGNVGAILRTADAAGLAGVVLADPQTDLYNPNAIRASLGAVFHIPVAAAPAVEVHQWLVSHGVHVYAARVEASTELNAVSFQTPAAIVVGNEADGLSTVWSDDACQAIRIPMRGIVDSLNVSVSAGILFYAASFGLSLGCASQ